jgi:hypothetical protein
MDEVGLWDNVLQRYGAAMDAQRAFLVSLLDERLAIDAYDLPEAFEPPHDMPAMPPEVEARATSLQAGTAELICAANLLLARSARPPTNHVRSTARSTASAMDRRL